MPASSPGRSTAAPLHYIQSESGTTELYDFVADPGELHDLASDSILADITGALHARLLGLMPGPIK